MSAWLSILATTTPILLALLGLFWKLGRMEKGIETIEDRLTALEVTLQTRQGRRNGQARRARHVRARPENGAPA